MKNLGKISDNNDIITKGYLEDKLTNLLSRSVVTVSEDNTSSIDIPSAIQSESPSLIYLNGILLEPDIHYTISSNRLVLSGHVANQGDLISFIYFSI